MENEWKKSIIQDAKDKKMCIANFKSLQGCSTKEQAIELYKRTIDWALENDYPSLNDIRRYFADCQSEGIYIDEKLDITVSTLQAYVFHNCRGTINVEMDYHGCTIPMLYFANGCDVKVVCRQPNKYPIRVPVYIYGDNKVRIENNGNATFVKYDLYKECV